jgi:hypothetical protein
MIIKTQIRKREAVEEERKTNTGEKTRRIISKSNSKKIRVKKKYRREKGIRERLWVSNPHSKADNSSRL